MSRSITIECTKQSAQFERDAAVEDNATDTPTCASNRASAEFHVKHTNQTISSVLCTGTSL
eukprot:14296-Heterococcus_DN1.PRE.2